MPARDAEKGDLDVRGRTLKYLGSVRGGKAANGLPAESAVPVGGFPGNERFYMQLELALRMTVIAMLLGSMVWMPETAEAYGLTRFSKFAALATCLMIFFASPTVGGVATTAFAGVAGSFVACLNQFLLRGFLPDGVEPGMSATSTENVVGWLNLAIFNFIVLYGNLSMGFRMTSMALNTGFMMCFLNPMDKTVFSKNFQIDPNGAAVSAFIGTCLGSLGATVAVALPYPLGWATEDMKIAAKGVSEDTCKLFIQAVDYFKGSGANLLIDRQLEQTGVLRAQIDGLGKNINDSFAENFDFSGMGTVRKLYETHSSIMGQIFDILNALQMAMSTEDFGESHVSCMEAIGAASHDLVDEASLLLMLATGASEDGDIDANEIADLSAQEARVKKAIKTLSQDFDKVRRKFEKPVCKELMNESFFVFCLSTFARIVCDYSTILRENRPRGEGVDGVALLSGMATLQTNWSPFASRIAARYWLSLMTCFLFSVNIDNYSPSCGITAVFLINTRVGPDVMAMIAGLLSVVVGVVMNSLMYSFSCKFGDTSVLMLVTTFYWLGTLLVALGNSSLKGIGLVMAALAPFAVMKRCVTMTPELEQASAGGLFGSIRALLCAVVITVVYEILFIPGMFTRLASESLDKAFKSMEAAFQDVFDGKDVDGSLGAVSDACGDANMYNTAAEMEPRFWKAEWQGSFFSATTASIAKARLDINIMKLALATHGKAESCTVHLRKVSEVNLMKQDLGETIEGARKLSLGLLRHEWGHFDGIENLPTVYDLDKLDGFEEALDKLCKVVKFPSKAPETMEEDELCQLSIIFVMLDYLIQHVSEVTKACVKLA